MAKAEQDGITLYYPYDLDFKIVKQIVSNELKKGIPCKLMRMDINYHACGGLIVRPHYKAQYLIGGGKN